MEVNRDLAAKEVPIIEFFKSLRDAGVTVTPELNAELRAEFGTSIPVGRADEVRRALEDGEAWKKEDVRREGVRA